MSKRKVCINCGGKKTEADRKQFVIVQGFSVNESTLKVKFQKTVTKDELMKF